MKQTDTIKKGITAAAFGCLLQHLQFTINSIDLLPNFLAYLLYLLAIHHLKEENREFGLLVPLGTLLVGWNLAQWLLKLFGILMEGKLPVLETMFAAVNLYFCFQFCTDIAQLAKRYQSEEQHLDQSICRCRTILTVTSTIFALPLGLLFREDWAPWILTPVLLAGLGAAVTLTVRLFSLRNRVLQRNEREDMI